MTEPNKTLLADETVLRAKLGGVDWPLRPFSLRDLSLYAPMLIERAGKTAQLMTTSDGIVALGDIVFAGLKSGHPELTREELDAMAIGFFELKDAVMAVLRQAGMFRDMAPGETAPAAPLGPATSQTGAP